MNVFVTQRDKGLRRLIPNVHLVRDNVRAGTILWGAHFCAHLGKVHRLQFRVLRQHNVAYRRLSAHHSVQKEVYSRRKGVVTRRTMYPPCLYR